MADLGEVDHAASLRGAMDQGDSFGPASVAQTGLSAVDTASDASLATTFQPRGGTPEMRVGGSPAAAANFATPEQNFPPASQLQITVEYVIAPPSLMGSSGVDSKQNPVLDPTSGPNAQLADNEGITPAGLDLGDLAPASDSAKPALNLPMDGEIRAVDLASEARPRTSPTVASLATEIVPLASTHSNSPGVANMAVTSSSLLANLPQVAKGAGLPGSGPAAAVYLNDSSPALDGIGNVADGATSPAAANATEGGMIQIGSTPRLSSPSSRHSGQNLSLDSDTPGMTAPGSVEDGARNEPGDDIEHRSHGTNSLPTDPAGGEPAEVAEDLTRSNEGGMVELAVGVPVADAVRASATADEAANRSPLAGGGEIRLDNGVGVFLAFELTTSPFEDDGEVRPASSRTSAPKESAAANPLSMFPGPATVANPSFQSEADDRSVQPAEAWPALAVVSFLATIDPLHVEETCGERQRRGLTTLRIRMKDVE
jgi:hypothetical protein